MQSDRSAKRQKLAKQIRRKQINTFMAECRSKMLLTWGPKGQVGTNMLLSKIVPGNMPEMERIKRFVQGLIKKDDESMKEEGKIGVDQYKINQLVTLAKGSKFSIKPTNQQSQLLEVELSQCLNAISQEICTIIQDLSKDLNKLSRITAVNQANQNLLQQFLAKTYQLTIDLKHISSYFNLLLAGCSQLLSTQNHESINQRIVEAITSCLIQLSCFRPRKYTNTINLPFLDQINKTMIEYRQIITVETNKQLLLLANYFAFESLNIKIIINVIYIFGNIFVSLSGSDSSGKGNYALIHEFIFGIFKHILKLQDHSFKVEQLKSSDNQQFAELGSLMVWFIRNQILIVEGMFYSLQGRKEKQIVNHVRQVDNNWIQISFFLLSKISAEIAKDPAYHLTEWEVTTIADILSLLHLLFNDFNLSSKYIWNAFILVYPFTSGLEQDKQNHKLLQAKIYQFFIDFLDYKFFDCQGFCLREQVEKINPYLSIYAQINTLLQRKDLTVAGLRLCCRVINPQNCLNDPNKMEVYQYICNNFQILLKKVQNQGQNKVIRQFIELTHVVIRIFEVVNHRTSMQVQLVSLDIMSHLLKLCQAMWQSQKNTQDIINCLQLLRTMADSDNMSNFVKQAILKEGYAQQLENLSAHPNQDINRLVYQIYELLDLQ